MKKIDAKAILNATRFDPNFEPPDEIPILMIDDKVIGTNQNIVTIQAKQKAGKTTYFTAIAASAITRMTIFRMTCRLAPDKKRVAYFDTEQGLSDFYKTLRRIKTLGSFTTYPAHFDAFNLREYGPTQIIAALNQYAADNIDCGLMIIDNSTDLLESFNDESESKTKIQYMKTWSKKNNNLIVQALHTGRATENSLGHFGAFSDRASQSVLQVEKAENGSLTMKPKYLRSAADFDPIAVMYNSEAHCYEETIYFEIDSTRLKNSADMPDTFDILENNRRLSIIFNSNHTLEHKFLIKGITELYAMPANRAKQSINYFLKEGMIYRIDNGQYTRQKQAAMFNINKPA